MSVRVAKTVGNDLNREKATGYETIRQRRDAQVRRNILWVIRIVHKLPTQLVSASYINCKMLWCIMPIELRGNDHPFILILIHQMPNDFCRKICCFNPTFFTSGLLFQKQP